MYVQQLMTRSRPLDDELEPGTVELVAQDDGRDEKQCRNPPLQASLDKEKKPEDADDNERDRFSIQIREERKDNIEQGVPETLIQELEELTIDIDQSIHLAGSASDEQLSDLSSVLILPGLPVQVSSNKQKTDNHDAECYDLAVCGNVETDDLPILSKLQSRVQEEKIPDECTDEREDRRREQWEFRHPGEERDDCAGSREKAVGDDEEVAIFPKPAFHFVDLIRRNEWQLSRFENSEAEPITDLVHHNEAESASKRG